MDALKGLEIAYASGLNFEFEGPSKMFNLPISIGKTDEKDKHDIQMNPLLLCHFFQLSPINLSIQQHQLKAKLVRP